jgi:FtsH-binding integral membrane protein
MAGGLLITALTAAYVASNAALVELMVTNRLVLYGLMGAELVLVFALSAAINKLTSGVALGMFLFYAALNGVTLSLIFLVYTSASLALTFTVTAGMFGATCAYGALTKRDLTSLGSFMFMGLIGLIIASFANFFLKSEMIYWLTSYFGVFIFVGLAAFDAQKVKKLAANAPSMASEDVKKASILGALALYLDFVNLFLYLLRFFGRRRD